MRDGDLLVRVPDCEVSIATDGEGALARIKSVQLSGVGRCERDELWQLDAPLTDAFREKKRSSDFETGNAVRHFFERRISAVFHLSFRIIVAVAGVIRREDIEYAAHKSLPDHLLVCLVAGWRAAHIFRALKTGPVEIVRGQEEILRAGFAVNFESPRLGQTDLLHRLACRDVHDQDRHIDQLGQRNRSRGCLAFGDRRMRHAVKARSRVTGCKQSFTQPRNDVVIFRMDHDERALPPRYRQHF